MEGLGHFRLSNNSMGNQVTISNIKMDSIAWGFADGGVEALGPGSGDAWLE